MNLEDLKKVNNSLTEPLFNIDTENNTATVTDTAHFQKFLDQFDTGELFEKAKSGLPIAL